MQIESLCKKEECLSCGACFAACEYDAIEMKYDELGVYYPDIKADKCVNCKQCKLVCPINTGFDLSTPLECYAAYTKEKEDVKTVSSGGVATAFGKHIVSKCGVVFGVDKKFPFSFCSAQSADEVNRFKGSKYVQVFPRKIYKEVKKELLRAKTCLFVGTPCQVAGLKSFLGNNCDGLITVDLICHGTSSLSYLQEWLESKVSDKIDSVSFRDEEGYKLIAKNGEQILYRKASSEDVYFCAFLTGLTLRENCYTCPFARLERVSDITIGDFWGLDKSALNGYAGKRSLILVNTEKGRIFFDEAKSLLNWEKRALEEALSKNDQLSFPTKPHSKRDDFKKAYIPNGFCEACKVSGIQRKVKKAHMENILFKIPRVMKSIFFK